MAAAQATEPASGEAPLPLPSPPPRIVRLKVLTLGDTLAGKSCLVKRYCEGRFVAKYIATIGVDYGVRRVGSGGRGGDDGDPVDLRLNFFDTSGVPRYADVRAEFLREAHVALLVFDVGARGGLDGLARWLAELRTGGAAVAGAAGGAMPAPPPPRVLVVGNKVGRPGSWRIRAGSGCMLGVPAHCWPPFDAALPLRSGAARCPKPCRRTCRRGRCAARTPGRGACSAGCREYERRATDV